MRKLTEQISAARVSRSTWPHLTGLHLADPSFGKPGKIDCIIDAELYGQLLTGNMRRGNSGEPIAQETAFGWILSGPADAIAENHFSQRAIRAHHAVVHSDLHEVLQAFWKVEEPPSQALKSPEDQQCKQHFASTFQRNEEGRFVVRLPLKTRNSELGDSRSIAVARWMRAESRLVHDELQAAMYHGFLREYETLEHMELVPNDDLKSTRKYYMPHHGVFKRSHDTAEVKIRVVFNASQASTNGRSLNDELLTGPKLQEDLWIVITRWRFFRFVFTTDVKMFRQILVSREDTNLQLIVWRETPKDELRTYRLLTVTYGTAAAPLLANRVLLELS